MRLERSMVTQPDAKKISVDKTKKIEKDRSAGTDKKMDNKVDEWDDKQLVKLQKQGGGCIH